MHVFFYFIFLPSFDVLLFSFSTAAIAPENAWESKKSDQMKVVASGGRERRTQSKSMNRSGGGGGGGGNGMNVWDRGTPRKKCSSGGGGLQVRRKTPKENDDFHSSMSWFPEICTSTTGGLHQFWRASLTAIIVSWLLLLSKRQKQNKSKTKQNKNKKFPQNNPPPLHTNRWYQPIKNRCCRLFSPRHERV